MLALHERRFQAVVVGGLVTVFAIVALAPHTERALFEEGSLPSAFAAVATDPVAPLLRRFGTMKPELFARAFRTDRAAGARPATRTALPGLIPPAIADQPPAFFALADDMAAPLVADAGVLGSQGNPGGFQRTSFTPGFIPGSGGGIVGNGVGESDPTLTDPTLTDPALANPTPTNPTPTDLAPTNPTPTDLTPTNPAPADLTPGTLTVVIPEPVSPIPEPASWIMILLGMTMVGGFTRRTRARIRATV